MRQPGVRVIGCTLAVVVSSLSAVPLAAQSCTWGGTSTARPPRSVALQAQRQLWRGPARVATDAAGRLYVSDPTRGRVLVRDADGRLLSAKTGLAEPLGLAVDAFGLIYVGERGTGSVTVYGADWEPLFQLGVGAGEFVLPNAITVRQAQRRTWVYVADSGADEIKVFADGLFVRRFGTHGRAAGQFDFPVSVALGAAGEIFVADQNNDRVQVFDDSGAFVRCFGGNPGAFSHRFGRVQGLAFDAQGRLYVADTFQDHVRVFDAQGVALATLGALGDGDGGLHGPGGLAVDVHGRLWVASTHDGRVQAYGLDAYDDPRARVLELALPAQLGRVSREPWLAIDVELPGGDPAALVAATVTANGVAAQPGLPRAGDRDGDGVSDVRFWFDAVELLAGLPDGTAFVTVAAELADGTPCAGSAEVAVIPGKVQP